MTSVYKKKIKKEETNDIFQFLIPKLNEVSIPKEKCKIDVTTEKTGNLRGDVWISTVEHTSNKFEKNIVALIEAKHKKTNIGDMDWRDAMHQGKVKGSIQELNFYIVTNCLTYFRYYNISNDEEITLDGKILTKLVSTEILQKIQTQVNEKNSHVIHKASKDLIPVQESNFRKSLKNLANTYRSAGLKKGDERIDPTVSFVVFKYISEKESEQRTLNSVIKLWKDFKNIVEGKEKRDLASEFHTSKSQIWNEESAYKNNIYKDFKDLINFSTKLKHRHFISIYKELDQYHFHGANFDLFGSIYEEFASQTKKKEFGEFYTRRHITGSVAKLLLRNEVVPRDLKICDPACGTGGFLTEAFKVLVNNFTQNNKYNLSVKNTLKDKTFYGYDNDDKSVARTKLNMFLVGDGHTNIHDNDSLVDWDDSISWNEEEFDYILTNPPMGKYDGEASIKDYQFTNEQRTELMFAERVIKAVNKGGEIALVLNDGALETPSRANFRIKILEHCDIYAIVSLTKFAFAPYTKEKTYVLFMQRKQKENSGEKQKFPIWHFILDYDGFANSDKRYKTKYHDDIPELEEIFDDAVKLAKEYISNKDIFNSRRKNFEREVNQRELGEGLWGKKYGYTLIDDINKENYFNLLSEYHLRPYKLKQISSEDFEDKLNSILISN